MEKGSKKRDRPNAFRSCRKCKEQKRRCELNEKVLLIEPSNEPLQKSDACNRCHILALPCILDDFEKIEKIAIKKRKEELVKKDSNENQERAHNIPLIESNSIITNNINSNTPSSSSITTSTGFDIFPTDSQDFKRYTPRSRPITLVSELSIRQPNFAKFRFDENENQQQLQINCYDLIDDFLGHKLSIWCENNLLIWLPGLIKPDQIRKSRKQNQPLSASIRIIELGQYLIAIQHSSSIQFKDEKEKDFLLLNLTKKIESLLSQLFLGSQRDLYASQALELLSVFPIASSYLNYYSSSQSNGNDKKIESLEVSVLSSSANRIASSCKQEYVLYKWQKEQEEQEEENNNNFDILDENDELEEESKKITAREFELRIQWCSCSAWEFSHCMGSNDIIKFYGVRSTPDLFQVNKLLLYFRSNPTPGLRGLGQLFVLLRSHLMACVLLSWEKLHDETPFALSRIKRIPKRTTTERLKILGKILEDHENRCEQSKAIRYSWLESHKSPQAQLLLTWLDMEDLAHSLMISGRTLFYALHKDENGKKIFNFTPKVLFQLINDSGKEDICSKEVRKFIFHHGDNRNDSAESLLMIASSLPSFCHSTPQMEFFIPILTTCGFIMEASMLSMEVHGTSARYWQSLPKRSRQWQMGMKGSIEMLNKLKDVEEQKGGISPTISRILTGMYEVITIWSRAINKSLITQNSLIQNQQIQSKENNNESTTTNTNTNLNPINNLPSTVEDQNKVAGIDVSIPPLATDGEQISLDQLLREMFGSTDWLDVLPSVQGGRLK